MLSGDLYIFTDGPLLTKYSNLSNISELKKRPLARPFLPSFISMYSVVGYCDREIYLTGGYSWPEAVDSVCMYDVKTNAWKDSVVSSAIPALTKARFGHSSCIHGSKLYVFGGQSQTGFVNSIELLQLSLGNNKNNGWDLLSQPLLARMDSVVFPVSDTEIAIIGGMGDQF